MLLTLGSSPDHQSCRSRGRFAIALALAAAVFVTGCTETSSTVSTNPDAVTTPKCQVSLGDPVAMGPDGGNGSVAVTTQPECAWTASSSVSWITALTPSSGQGNGSVAFRVTTNDTAGAREGDIVINDIRAHVSQRAPCRYDVSPASQNIDAAGGSGSLTITTVAECSWSAAADVPWITFPSAGSGTGSGTVAFSVAANTTALDRVGTIAINGQRATISQPAPPAPNCNSTITPTTQNIGAAGGAGTAVTVTMQGATCRWTAASNVPWISVTTGANGTGNGTVTFTVAANTGAARTGTLTIAGRTFTVNQVAAAAPPPACTYSISSGSQNVVADGGTGTVNVTAGSTCAWTATSNAAWIAVTSGASGTGNGAVGYSVQANTGAARSGTITIAGQTFTVNQAAVPAPPPCTYSISSNSQNLPTAGGTGSVNVTAGSTCAWTATSNAAWITITAGASGTGNGTVSYFVSANTGGARSGTITIAGQTFTINQAALSCSFTVAPTSFAFTAAAGTGTVAVTTSAGCAWTATTNDAFITITSGGSGTGSGTVTFSVSANTGKDRKGNLTVAGKNVSVDQKGP